MANSTIPQLLETTEPENNFVLPVDSGVQTYKLQLQNLLSYFIANLPEGVIQEALIASGAVTETKLANNSVIDSKVSASANIAGSKIQPATNVNVGTVSHESSGNFNISPTGISNVAVTPDILQASFHRVGSLVFVFIRVNVDPINTGVATAFRFPASNLPFVMLTSAGFFGNCYRVTNPGDKGIVYTVSGSTSFIYVGLDSMNSSGNAQWYVSFSYLTS